MSPPVLLQSSVGRMPTAARWYLAGTSMLVLVLVAVHFALQVTAQQQARSQVAAWAAQSGATVGSVRLRMLRGALTVSDFRWHGEGISAHLPFLLLRGDFTAAGETPRLTEIRFRHADVRLAKAFGAEEVLLPAWLPPLLQKVRLIDGDADLVLMSRDDGLPREPVHLGDVHYVLHGKAGKRQWQADGRLFNGRLDVQAGPAGVDVRFEGMDADRMEAAVGLAALPGRLRGAWQLKGDRQRGELELRAADDEEHGRLVWQGRQGGGGWRIDAHGRHWPLAMLAPFAPRPGGSRLVAGYLDAAMHLQSSGKGWKVRLPSSDIEGLTFTDGRAGARQGGVYVRQLHLVDVALAWPERQLKAARAELQDASLALEDGAGVPLPDWQIDCDAITVERLRPGIRTGSTMFWLPDVSGKASLSEKGRFELALATTAGEEEQWRLQGEGTMMPGQPWRATLQFEGGQIPFVRLRPLLEGHLADGRDMAGMLSLRGEWHFGAAAGGVPWRLAGKVHGKDISLMLDGRQWGAASVDATLAEATPAAPPHFADMAADDWFCLAALQPMRSEPASEVVERPPFWFGDWRIDKLALRSGSVSFGQADARWLEHADVTLAPIAPGKSIAMNMQGTLAEGALKVKGEWNPWGEASHFSGEATLRHALPFVLRDWLHLSGMPRLTRGRISAKLKLRDDGLLYTGSLDVEMAHAALEGGAFGDDPLPDRIGYRAIDLFERLGAAGRARVHVPLEGRWSERPLGWGVLADALLQGLKRKAEEGRARSVRRSAPLILSHIRLHQESGLQHNERVRLRQVIAYLRQHKKMAVELMPQIGNLPLDAALVERVRQTQRYIEMFMVDRGVNHGRIVPVWPSEIQRSGEATGIRIQAVM
jgi:hypothetical protein